MALIHAYSNLFIENVNISSDKLGNFFFLGLINAFPPMQETCTTWHLNYHHHHGEGHLLLISR